MTEAVAAVNDHAFAELGFDRLVFSNARGNLASRRVKEKSGARFVRTEPAQFVDPSLTEREVWETTKADWLAFRAETSRAGTSRAGT
jgi:RimJ/RimL family protein N-acetyltransferase